MAACTTCNLCDNPGTIDDTPERGLVPSNVRRFQHDRFTVWRCRNCRSLHCAEDVDLPRYYADYPLLNQPVDLHARIGLRNRLRLLRRHGVELSHRVLDYGCGKGLFLDVLRANGAAAAAGYDAFVPAYADTAPLSDTYDAVVSWDVIEHADEPRAFVSTVAALARPGGLVAIGTPNAEHLSVGDIRSMCLHQPYHRHILSETALVALGVAAGLVVESVIRRSYFDSLVPGVNWRFMRGYNEAAGGLLDASFEPPRTDLVLKSPRLLAAMFFGSLLPPRDNMIVMFRRRTAGQRATRRS